MSTYFEELKRSCEWLAKQSDRAVFIGQAVAYKGTGITGQLVDIQQQQKIELPVFEDTQAGIAIGLAIAGYLPICVYPRFDFMLLAANQIVNHLDKWNLICDRKCSPKIIFKVAVGSIKPLDPGLQHKNNYLEEFRNMCDNIKIIDLHCKQIIFDEYKDAYDRQGSTILVEYGDKYNE